MIRAQFDFLRLITLTIWACRTVSALAPITVKGSKFYDEDGKQFYLKGVTYTRLANDEDFEDARDPLLDREQCEIDAELLKELGANTIRVYVSITDGDHDDCMKAFADAGIYVWLDLYSMDDRMDPIAPGWTQTMFDGWARTMDMFSGYDNMLLFSIADSVIASGDLDVAPFVKAAARDMKAHRKARGFRPIPLIYTSWDYQTIRKMAAEYLACGDEDETIDAFAITVRSWCDGTAFFDRGYDQLTEEFGDFHLPVMFMTGCDDQEGRAQYPDVKGILGRTFEDIFSGVMVFDWAVESSPFSLVEYDRNNDSAQEPSTLSVYNSLSLAFSSAVPSGTVRENYTPSNSAAECEESVFFWAGRKELPTIRGLNFDGVTRLATWTEEATTQETGNRTGPTQSSEISSDAADGDRDADGSSSNDDVKKGLMIGLPIAAVLGIGLASWCIWNRRRKRRIAAESVSTPAMDRQSFHPNQSVIQTPEMSSDQRRMTQELDGRQSWVAHGYYVPSPAAHPKMEYSNGDGQVYELPGGR